MDVPRIVDEHACLVAHDLELVAVGQNEAAVEVAEDVIREATRRFLNGQMPYATYRSYDTSWDMVMPYGPALWGPFVVAQLLRLDFRVITAVGELLVPIWCGVASVVEASRGRIGAAVSWLVLLAALLFALDVQRFTLLAHTPVYWPLFLPLAVTMRTPTHASC